MTQRVAVALCTSWGVTHKYFQLRCKHLSSFGSFNDPGVTKRNLFLCGDGEVQPAELSVPIKQRVCLFCLRNEKIKQSTQQTAATGIDECHIITNYVTTSWRVTWLALYRDKNIHRNVCYRRSCVAAGDGSLKCLEQNRTRKVDQIFCYFTRICCDLPSPLSCWSSILPNLKYHLNDLQIANPET